MLVAARAVYPGFDKSALTALGFMQRMKDAGLPVVVHIDDASAAGLTTGCAFNDSLSSVASNVMDIFAACMRQFCVEKLRGAEAVAALRQLAERIVAVTRPADVSGIDTFGECAADRLDAVRSVGGVVDVLSGEHHIWGADFSWRQGFTLDRNALNAASGTQLLHIDAWSFRATASCLAGVLPRSNAQMQAGTADDEIERQIAAALWLQSIATASMMCGPHTPMIMRR